MKKYLTCIAMLFMAAFCLTSCGGDDEVDVAGGSLAKTSWIYENQVIDGDMIGDVQYILSFSTDSEGVLYSSVSLKGVKMVEANLKFKVVDFDGKAGKLLGTASSQVTPEGADIDKDVTMEIPFLYDAELNVLQIFLGGELGMANFKRAKYQPLEFIDFTTGKKEDPAETKQVFVENGREVPILRGEVNVKERAEGCVRLMFYTKNGTIEVAVDDSYLGKKIDLSKYDDQTLNSFYIDAEGPDFFNDDEDRLYGAESGMQADEGGYLIVKELEKNKQYEVEAAYTHDGSSYKLSFKGEVSKVGEEATKAGVIKVGSKEIEIAKVGCEQWSGHTDFRFMGANGESFDIITFNYEQGVEHDLTKRGTNEKWYSFEWHLSPNQTRDGGNYVSNFPENEILPTSGTFKYTRNGDTYSVRLIFVYEGEEYSIEWEGESNYFMGG